MKKHLQSAQMELGNVVRRAHNSRYVREVKLPEAKQRRDEARAELDKHLAEHDSR